MENIEYFKVKGWKNKNKNRNRNKNKNNKEISFLYVFMKLRKFVINKLINKNNIVMKNLCKIFK